MPSQNDNEPQGELVHGTHVHQFLFHQSLILTNYDLKVPSVDLLSSDELVLGKAMTDIKAAWVCQKHTSGACFITKENSHIELNRLRLTAFGHAVVRFIVLFHLPVFDLTISRLQANVSPPVLLRTSYSRPGLVCFPL